MPRETEREFTHAETGHSLRADPFAAAVHLATSVLPGSAPFPHRVEFLDRSEFPDGAGFQPCKLGVDAWQRCLLGRLFQHLYAVGFGRRHYPHAGVSLPTPT